MQQIGASMYQQSPGGCTRPDQAADQPGDGGGNGGPSGDDVVEGEFEEKQ